MLLATVSAAYGTEVGDTTFTVKDKKVVVDVDGSKTTVKVYNAQGVPQTKTREMEFVDGQEVERVFVGSPFVPTSQLQNYKFRSHYPTVWFGFASLLKKPWSSYSGYQHGRKSKSFSLGFTPYSIAIPFDKSQIWGVTAAFQAEWVHQCFQKDYAVGQQGNLYTFTKLDRRAEGNNINYGVFKLPVMLSVQNEDWGSVSLGLAPELRTNASYKLTAAPGSGVGNMSGTYHINRFGLSMVANITAGPIVWSTSIGLLPLFKSTDGKKAYQMTTTFGIDIYEIGRLLRGSKKDK